MKAVIAIDSFKGSLTSLEAGNSAATGIRRVFPDAECIVRPLADGGEGTVDALVAACAGKNVEISVTGPLGAPVLCRYGVIEKTKTAIIEMSGAAGITLVPASERNPLFTTTFGVGEVIQDAIEKAAAISSSASVEAPPTTAEPVCSRRWAFPFAIKTGRPSVPVLWA